MKILHITGHLGGGIGTTVIDWMATDKSHSYWLHSLDYINPLATRRMNYLDNCHHSSGELDKNDWHHLFSWADIVVVHWWDNKLLSAWIEKPMPAARMVMWVHQNYNMNPAITKYADRFIVTSPVIGGHWDCIKSTGNFKEFLTSSHLPQKNYSVGYVGTVHLKKIHPNFISMCEQVDVPGIKFFVYGDNLLPQSYIKDRARFSFMGNVEISKYHYSLMDVFGYPLRADHYGTSELVLGEAMSAGVVPVCMNNDAERLIIKNGLTGFLCEDEREYIENITYLSHKPSLRKWLGDNARQSAYELYNIDTMIGKWNYVFGNMMENEKRKREPVIITEAP